MDRVSVSIVVLLVVAWLTQIYLSGLQMRRFHAKSQQLRRMGTHMSIGLGGTMYRRKVYVAVVTGPDDRVVAAEQLGGWTVFARSTPIPEVVGIPIERLGRNSPPTGVSSKTWAALDHAAGFIRGKLAKEGRPGEHPTGEEVS
jgi:DNA-binding transcriptional regulator of glucitol operon